MSGGILAVVGEGIIVVREGDDTNRYILRDSIGYGSTGIWLIFRMFSSRFENEAVSKETASTLNLIIVHKIFGQRDCRGMRKKGFRITSRRLFRIMSAAVCPMRAWSVVMTVIPPAKISLTGVSL
jgi:hypothetical protein